MKKNIWITILSLLMIIGTATFTFGQGGRGHGHGQGGGQGLGPGNGQGLGPGNGMGPGGGFGQGPCMQGEGFGWWNDQNVIDELALSDDQREEILNLAYETRLQLINLHAAVETERLELMNMLQDENNTSSSLSTQVDSLVDAFAQERRARLMMMIDIRDILTPAQREQFETMLPPPPPMR